MDKPYMTIDPANDALYVVWTDFGTTRGPNVVRIYFSGQIALSTAVIRDRTDPSPALCSCRDRMPVTGGAAGRTGPGPAEPVPDSGTEDKKEDGSCANRSFTR